MKRTKTTSQQPVINISFMGPTNVGKTAIIQRFLGEQFSTMTSHHQPTVFDFYEYVEAQYTSGNFSKTLCLNISDTSGTFDFPAMDRHTIHNSDVIVVVFDLGKARTFHCAVKLAAKIKLTAPTTPIIFVGNKSELKSSATDADEIEDYVMCTLNHAYVEMSAKYDDNVDKLLRRIYEENEISMGPYSVQKGKKNIISKLTKKMTKKVSKFCNKIHLAISE